MSSYQFVVILILGAFLLFFILFSRRHATQVQENIGLRQKILEAAKEAQKDVQLSNTRQEAMITELREIKQLLKDKGNPHVRPHRQEY